MEEKWVSLLKAHSDLIADEDTSHSFRSFS